MATTGGKVPKTAAAHVKKSSVGDNTVQDAVYGVTGVLYTQLTTLASNCKSGLIDQTNGGTRGVTPTQLSHFRGYPRPTIKMNWELIEDTLRSGSTLETFEELWVQPQLTDGSTLTSIGFDITITVDVDQATGVSLPGSPENRATYTFTFAGGSTYPTSTTGTFTNTSGSGSSKKWQINDWLPPTVNDVVTYVATVSTTASDDVYYDATDGSTDTDTLAYQSQTVYTESMKPAAFGSACSSDEGGTPATAYFIPTAGSAIDNGTEIWSDYNLTTHLANGNYIFNYVGLGTYDYCTVTSGICSSVGSCP